MAAYYNEHNRFAAAWLRELIEDGQIVPGDIDERDIQKIDAEELRDYTQVHLFAGIGGWSHALRLAGWPDDRPVWTGSCPCQPYSVAGKRQGKNDPRHLWPDMFRLIRQRRPVTVFGEQVVPAVSHGWLDGVFDDLENEGYTCGAAVLGAHSVGAPHMRQRLFWVANADGSGFREHGRAGAISTQQPITERSCGNVWDDSIVAHFADGKSRRLEPRISPLADGIPGRVGALCGYGNAIVPQVAVEFIKAFTGDEYE
jgi:DNA (cytosine-5)-methyltransferase 1